MKVFLIGPVAGMPFFNVDLFHAAEQHFLEQGCIVFNPVAWRESMGINPRSYPRGDFSDPPTRWTMPQRLKFCRMAADWDTQRILESTHTALLPGWDQNRYCRSLDGLADSIGLPYIFMPPAALELPPPPPEWQPPTDNPPRPAILPQQPTPTPTANDSGE